jgi:hypothetical protein
MNYNSYYKEQRGYGLGKYIGPYYQKGYGYIGPYYQKGYGIGSFFQNRLQKFLSWIKPIAKNVAHHAAKTLSNEAANTFSNISSDINKGIDFKETVKNRASEALDNLKGVAGEKLKNIKNKAQEVVDFGKTKTEEALQQGSGIKRKRRLKNYIILKKRKKQTDNTIKDIFD